MAEPELIEPTGDRQCDKIAQGVIGIFETAFPAGCAVSTSVAVTPADGIGAALNLKLATRLLYGEDIRPELPSFNADTYVRSVIHTPYLSYAYPVQRRNADSLVPAAPHRP